MLLVVLVFVPTPLYDASPTPPMSWLYEAAFPESIERPRPKLYCPRREKAYAIPAMIGKPRPSPTPKPVAHPVPTAQPPRSADSTVWETLGARVVAEAACRSDDSSAESSEGDPLPLSALEDQLHREHSHGCAHTHTLLRGPTR